MVALLAWAPGAAGNQTRDGNLRLTALDETLKELTARVLPAVVQIVVTGYTVRDEATTPGDLLAPQRTSGSGVILDPDGYVVTNAHVVEGATRIQVGLAAAPADQAPGRSILAARMRLVGAQIVGVDHETDLAVLKVNASALPALALGDSEQVAPGQVVLAFGSPFRLDGSVTLGVISATARQLAPESPVIHVQTDAPINPGSSGGPLVDTAGRVIGINTLIVSQSGMGQGLGFAVPSNIVRNVFEQLRKTGRVRRGEIGVRAQTITPALAAALGLTRTWGVILSDVYPGGPAAREGLRTDDVVLSLDGKIMENGRQLQVNLYSRAPGQRVQIEVLRGENRRTYGVMVVERAGDPTQLMERVTARQNLVPELGVLALDLPEELAGALPGLREPRGVVVAAVAGEQAGRFDGDALVAGDVIRAINLSPIATLGDLRAFLRQARRGQPIALHVERRGELRYLVMELE